MDGVWTHPAAWKCPITFGDVWLRPHWHRSLTHHNLRNFSSTTVLSSVLNGRVFRCNWTQDAFQCSKIVFLFIAPERTAEALVWHGLSPIDLCSRMHSKFPNVDFHALFDEPHSCRISLFASPHQMRSGIRCPWKNGCSPDTWTLKQIFWQRMQWWLYTVQWALLRLH